ncbi:hypothetical protein BC936DRAFT_148634, partial [Jimgerdemannia flammicorona]
NSSAPTTRVACNSPWLKNYHAHHTLSHVKHPRLDAYTQNMLHLFERLLGRDFWRYVIIVFTHVDEDNRDLLDDNIDVLSDPTDGFAAELGRIFALDPATVKLPTIFLTTKNVKYSTYAHQCLQDLYDSIRVREEQARGKKFSCHWFRQILATPSDEEKTGFIVASVREAVGALRNIFSSGGGGGSGGSSQARTGYSGRGSQPREERGGSGGGWCPIQ